MKINRIISQYSGHSEGPILIFTAAIHGNETAGVLALQEVFRILETKQPSINGSIVGLAGNLGALEREVRQIDRDLNRIWLTEESYPEISEFNERDEIVDTLNAILSSQQDEVYFFDLHSLSSESTPFVMLSDTLRNRELAHLVGVPIILGLMEHLEGMLIDITSRLGFQTLLFQGGRSGKQETVVNHMGLIWKVLEAKCSLDTSMVPECHESIEQLNSFGPTPYEPEFYEISNSYRIQKGTDFKMKPGYMNFQPVKKGEVLGSTDGVDVKAPRSGRIFMPLYQEGGTEGFYVVNPIARFWIRFSRRFRLFNYHQRLNWLPGVSKISRDPLTFKLDTHVTLIWAVEVFHLLGYIKVRQVGPILFMTRREDETNPPSAIEAIQQFKIKAYLRTELKKIKTDWRIPYSSKYYVLIILAAVASGGHP